MPLEPSSSESGYAVPRSLEGAAPPLFIVGCARSGTTLLRMMLNAHPELAIPEESQFIYKLARRRALGRGPADVETDAGWEALIRWLEKDPYIGRWRFASEALRERLAQLPERSYAAAFRAVFVEFMEQQGKSRWGDKTPQHVQYLLILDRLFPKAKFIHVVRDGRDVALSLMTRPWGPPVMAMAGYYWKWLVLSGQVGGRLLGPDRYREVHYEELVLNPEDTLQDLCEWAGLEYTPSLLEYHETDAAQEFAKRGKVARRLTEPPDPSRVQRWKHDLSDRHRRSLHRQAGDLLAQLGYSVDHLPRRQQRAQQRWERLLQTEQLASLSERVTARSGSDIGVRGGLLWDRFRQGVTLLLDRAKPWTHSSIRWQRTVANLLE